VTIESRNGRFSFSTSQINELASGENREISVSTASTETGKVSGVIQLIATSVEDGTNIEAIRQLTLKSEPEGADKELLIYALKNPPSDPSSNGSIRVYNPATDTVRDPPQTRPASALGDTADIVGDSTVDIPYLTKQGSNRVYATTVGESSDTQIPKSNSTKPKIKPQRTRIAVGEWQPADLSGKLILAKSKIKDDTVIAGVDADGNAEVIAQPENGCTAVMGVADVDDDGSDEIIFLDGSSAIRYLNQDGSTEKVPTGGVGSNNGRGIGPPADFDGDGVPRVPFIDGSQNPALTTGDGVITRLNKNGVARKAGVAPVDIDADGDLELVFFGNDEGKIQYVDDVLGSNTIETLKVEGSTVSPEEKIGLGFGRQP
jgi:phosphotransferase system HPr-like phosphotransfer protein